MTQSRNTGYLVAIGSNRRGRHGSPTAEVRAALDAIHAARAAPIVASAPLGPSIRCFDNTVAWVESDSAPEEMLARLKAIERAFGRRRGRRWGARVIDLDIIWWSGGMRRTRALTVPHAAFRTRDFVLAPAAAIAPALRDPVTGRTLRQLNARLTRSRPLPTRNPLVRGP